MLMSFYSYAWCGIVDLLECLNLCAEALWCFCSPANNAHLGLMSKHCKLLYLRKVLEDPCCLHKIDIRHDNREVGRANLNGALLVAYAQEICKLFVISGNIIPKSLYNIE